MQPKEEIETFGIMKINQGTRIEGILKKEQILLQMIIASLSSV
jgi:hypothetical protein